MKTGGEYLEELKGRESTGKKEGMRRLTRFCGGIKRKHEGRKEGRREKVYKTD